MAFEEAYAKLSEVVETLERGDLPLDDAVRFYEQGAELAQLCERKLREAELRVEQWRERER